MRDLNLISGTVVDAAYHLHSALGPGLLESVYEVIRARELEKRGLQVERQTPVPLVFDGLRFDEGFRADLIAENCVVVELKSVEEIARVPAKQLLTCLRLLDFRLGLLINFGAPVIKNGIRRMVNRFRFWLRSAPLRLRVRGVFHAHPGDRRTPGRHRDRLRRNAHQVCTTRA
jgi:GxxExxY protein